MTTDEPGALVEAWREPLRQAVLDALPPLDPAAGEEALEEVRRYRRLLRDYPERGGKGLRGALLLLSTAAHGGEPARALPVAAALELFQHWVLIHDDVEDGSEERRGSPALHRLVGEPVAINVGDGLHVCMWGALLNLALPRREAILQEFLTTIHRTAEGQHLDLAWVASGRMDVSEAEYLAMVTRKTARYTVVAPLRLGGLCADAAPHPDLARAGERLGAAFQIRDDVLNLLPDERSRGYGKEFAGDLVEGKRTLVLAHAFAHLDAGDAARLRALLQAPREAKDAALLEEAVALLHRHDSLGYAQRRAEALGAEGMAALEVAFEGAPGAQALDEMRALLATLTARSG